MLFPIIMAGGTGTRLWPLSRRTITLSSLFRFVVSTVCCRKPC